MQQPRWLQPHVYPKLFEKWGDLSFPRPFVSCLSLLNYTLLRFSTISHFTQESGSDLGHMSNWRWGWKDYTWKSKAQGHGNLTSNTLACRLLKWTACMFSSSFVPTLNSKEVLILMRWNWRCTDKKENWHNRRRRSSFANIIQKAGAGRDSDISFHVQKPLFCYFVFLLMTVFCFLFFFVLFFALFFFWGVGGSCMQFHYFAEWKPCRSYWFCCSWSKSMSLICHSTHDPLGQSPMNKYSLM